MATPDPGFIFKRDIGLQFLCKLLNIFKLYFNELLNFRGITTESAITQLLITETQSVEMNVNSRIRDPNTEVFSQQINNNF